MYWPNCAFVRLAFLLIFGAGLMTIPTPSTAAPTDPATEISFDIWDWTPPAQDLAMFEDWAIGLKDLGVTRIELSTPWRLLEPEPGRIDLSYIADRLAICKLHGLGMRLRINSYYAGATPDWYSGDRWHTSAGELVPGVPPPSISDERFWAHYAPLCTAIARLVAGEDVYLNAFIGIHAELKYGDWWTYDPASMAKWRAAIASPRPAWLTAVVADDASLPATPPVPAATHGLPDTSPASLAFIAFREHTWREAIERFTAAVRAGDPHAKISSPLGESFRSGSAQMSNLDYWGLSRGAQQVVHSYDFFWHVREAPWLAAAAVQSFRGITGLPVCFEYDGYSLITQHGYTREDLLALGREAAAAGAGLKLANYSYLEKGPPQWDLVRDLIACWREVTVEPPGTYATAPAAETTLVFISKWANYCYREPTEWLHDAQFGLWRMLVEAGLPVRIICEDNLEEDLSGYRALVRAFSPVEVIPAAARSKLDALALPTLIDVEHTPAPATIEAPIYAEFPNGRTCIATPALPLQPAVERAPELRADKPRIILGYPIGHVYLHGPDAAQQRALLAWALEQLAIASPRH